MNCTRSCSLLLLALLLSGACHTPENRSAVRPSAPPPEKELLAAVNRRLADKEKDIIEAFIRRKAWNMTLQPDGYYSQTLRSGSGAPIRANDAVSLRCDIRLLDGTPCYIGQIRHLRLNGTAEMAGLHLGMKNARPGAQLRFIFPPHMAYGLPGDHHKIPPRATIVVEVEVLKVNETNE